MISFKKLHYDRKHFLIQNRDKDFVLLEGSNKILISAPHGVPQTRLGKIKLQEPGSLATALNLKSRSNCFFIAKTQNNFDDANFDENSAYKDAIKNLIRQKKIKYIVDIHCLAKNRPCDVNLGIGLGRNVAENLDLFNHLEKSLASKGFKTSIDAPFMGGFATIAGSMKNCFPKLWTVQIEINCSITNSASKIDKWNTLIDLLLDFIKEIENL